jgi:hypothetical protein
MWASSRPKTALFGNLGVDLRISLCGVQEYASAQILDLLDLARKSFVFASGTAPSPPEFPDENGLATRSVVKMINTLHLQSPPPRPSTISRRRFLRKGDEFMSLDLNEENVLITGASSGIGRACAEAFAARGC